MSGFMGRIVPADVGFDVVDAAVGFLVFGFNQVGTDGEIFFGFGVVPDPAKMVYPGEQIFAAQLAPAIDVPR